MFPSSANVQQAGAYFKTRSSLWNANDEAITTRAQLLTPEGNGPLSEIVLEPFSAILTENFLLDVSWYTGGSGLTLAESTNSLVFHVTAELYADGPGGRYTTPLTGLASRDRIPSPPAWSSRPASLTCRPAARSGAWPGNVYRYRRNDPGRSGAHEGKSFWLSG